MPKTIHRIWSLKPWYLGTWTFWLAFWFCSQAGFKTLTLEILRLRVLGSRIQGSEVDGPKGPRTQIIGY